MTDFPTFWADWRRISGRCEGKAVSRSLYTGITNGGMWVRTQLGDKLFLDASHDELCAALKAKVGGLDNEPQYRPHCQTWLRQGRFEDEPEGCQQIPMREVTETEYRVKLREEGSPYADAETLPEFYKSGGRYMVPEDWRPEIKLVGQGR